MKGTLQPCNCCCQSADRGDITYMKGRLGVLIWFRCLWLSQRWRLFDADMGDWDNINDTDSESQRWHTAWYLFHFFFFFWGTITSAKRFFFFFMHIVWMLILKLPRFYNSQYLYLSHNIMTKNNYSPDNLHKMNSWLTVNPKSSNKITTNCHETQSHL